MIFKKIIIHFPWGGCIIPTLSLERVFLSAFTKCIDKVI
ncbi:hypothetical protein [uncultured Gammaproteobacteria bacterium]|nr:hypothetical protein [uncultured Gammaproteobacteria bacterium]